ncbi:Non-canonical purine NTP pyrophosphatase [Halomicronema hongdechloris C2206]|uniref:dITP/XTP pyrophosphatase n=1 Tax=Halomicronema hongdechloris C2206 TaxID=1641165 RepID=A0A1Z3HT45_9CYAN|nr:RdgB/HAM1 family non-canonical purine NTP pyrophosphatase [Halomicronema hongdechloris]ASC73490.1 Non-canonical purine NTP pyrophosphatase [Halomicronema hongdechloris C2206]
MVTVVVATGNPGKLKELQAHLADLAWQLTLKPPELEVEETGQTFLENARLKAAQVAQATGQWAIADDSGLEVDALGGAPGIYSARYADSDASRIERVLRELGDRPERGAQFVCALALSRPDGTIALETEGICRGELLLAPRGIGGFGYDPIFYLPALGLTFAEMTSAQKAEHSHRAIAFRQLLPQLKAHPSLT